MSSSLFLQGLEQVSKHSPGLNQSQVSSCDAGQPTESAMTGIGNPAFEDLDDSLPSFQFVEELSDKEEKSRRNKSESNSFNILENISNVPQKQSGEAEDTFRLAKDSSLFSRVSKNYLTSADVGELCYHEPREQKLQMVEVKALEIIKSVVTAVEPMEVYPSSSCHMGPQTVEMVEIVEDTEESAPDTDSDSPAVARRISPLPVHVKSFSEILLKGKGEKPVPLPRSCEQVKQIQVVEVRPDETAPLCLEMTDRVNRTEETTVTAWRYNDSKDGLVHSAHQIVKEAGPKLTLRKEVEVSKTYQLIGNYSPDSEEKKIQRLKNFPKPSQGSEDLASPSTSRMVTRRGKRTVTEYPEEGLTQDGNWDHIKRVKTESSKDAEDWDRDSFYGSDKETDDVVEFSDNDSIVAAVTSHTIIETSEDDTSSSDDEDPAFYNQIAAGKVGWLSSANAGAP